MANKPYKLLVADIDGTLLGKQGTISTEDKNALARASNAGIKITLSTGRVPQATLKIIEQLSLDGLHIFSDGALVANTENGEEAYIKPISAGTIRQIVEFVHRQEINLDLFSTTRFFAEKETWVTDIRRKFFGVQPTFTNFSRLGKEKIIKGTLGVLSDEERAKADSFRRQFRDSLNFSVTKTPSYPEVDFINVLAPDVSKGQALEALASHLGIPLTEVIAIGNGTNDISLLAKVGLAIAMDNAPDELKAVADYVTLDVEHSGVAAAIEKFLLSED
ncbi:MAG: HAD family phosphatase [Chloroflexi bacterium]|nr:HAD family phosphatase [Chloroflexota bacterium]